tara:strand:+ start:1410 stop:2042 length:633 start_codon:yes stop_codon:yes gene_type:complete
MTQRTIFKALSAVQSDLSIVGIAKNQQNSHQGYKFRGIDDVLNTLAPIIAEHGVLIIPNVLSKDVKTINTARGGVASHVILEVGFVLYDQEGDSICHTAYGEAIDTSDKAVNKAMTAAYKYFLFQAFCIPIEGLEDADSQQPEQAELQPALVTADTLAQIISLCEETGEDIQRYVDWAEVSETKLIPQEKAVRIAASLTRKKEAKNEGQP